MFAAYRHLIGAITWRQGMAFSELHLLLEIRRCRHRVFWGRQHDVNVMFKMNESNKVMIVKDVYCRIVYFTWRFVVKDDIYILIYYVYIIYVEMNVVDGCVEVLVTLCMQRESGLPASRVGMCFRNQNRSIWVGNCGTFKRRPLLVLRHTRVIPSKD